MKIDMWHGDKFIPGKYRATYYFYPHGSFGYAYQGNIFDDSGVPIGDFACNDSVEIEKAFIITKSWIVD